MGWFRCDPLSAKQTLEALQTLRRLLREQLSSPYPLDIRSAVDDALVKNYFVLGTSVGASREVTVTSAIGKMFDPNKDPVAVAGWAKSVTRADVIEIVDKAIASLS